MPLTALMTLMEWRNFVSITTKVDLLSMICAQEYGETYYVPSPTKIISRESTIVYHLLLLPFNDIRIKT